jgi:hypothetical protein
VNDKATPKVVRLTSDGINVSPQRSLDAPQLNLPPSPIDWLFALLSPLITPPLINLIDQSITVPLNTSVL